MKKSDIAMIILIAIVSVMVAFFVTRSLFGGSATEPVKVKTIQEISSEVIDPDPAIFNNRAINPAIEVQIAPQE
jgi:ABC-type cobalt transport system substrate-binding protein